MRRTAYLLAADPAWVEESVASYYDLVERIIVCYDESAISWTGRPLAVEESLSRLHAVDHDHKMVDLPGNFHDRDGGPMALETHQRNVALAAASDGADWVLQLDTDEMLASPGRFAEVLEVADRRGFHGLEYPARNLYQHIRGDRYLEWSSRWWRIIASYPGPAAVRAGTKLEHARQGPTDLYRVDFAAHNTDPAHPIGTIVNSIVRPSEGILHYSWVRSDEEMSRKTQTWGHANDTDWAPQVDHWRRSRRRPMMSLAGSLSPRSRAFLRLARIDTPPGPEALARNRIG